MNRPDREPVPAIWRLPYNLYKWLVVGPFLLLSTLAVGCTIIVMCFVGLGRYANPPAMLWARLNAYVALMKVRVEGREKLTRGQSYVLAANHGSLVDIYVLYGFSGLNLRWVMKKELRSVPVLGLACDLMGHIYVDRSDAGAAVGSIRAARKLISNGVCAVFFPEGTRSRTTELRPFKKGAFRMANELKIPVVPVSIHDTGRVLPPDTLDWRPGKVRLVFHEPVPTGELGAAEVAQLAGRTRNIIVDALGQG